MDNIPRLTPRRSVKRVIYCENDARRDVVDVAFKTAQKSVETVTGVSEAATATEICTSTCLSNEDMQRQNFTPSRQRPSMDVDPKKYDPGEKASIDTSGMKFMKFEKGFGPEMESDEESRGDEQGQESIPAALARAQNSDYSLSLQSPSSIYEQSAQPEARGQKLMLPSTAYRPESAEPSLRHPLSTATFEGRFSPQRDSLQHAIETEESYHASFSGEIEEHTIPVARRAAQSPREDTLKESEAKTVFSDPRARELPFMQPSSNGWTPHLDDYVHSRPKDEGRNTSSKSDTHHDGSSKLASNITAASSKKPTQRSRPSYSYEETESDARFTRIQRIFNERSTDKAYDVNKTLPSPPIANLSSEIGGDSVIKYRAAPRAYHRRAETAPSVPTPFVGEFDQATPFLTTEAPSGVRAYQAEPRARFQDPAVAYREGSPVRRGPSYDTASPRDFDALDYPTRGRETELGRKPSRMDRLRNKLSRSPERRGRSPIRRGNAFERDGMSPERRPHRFNRSPTPNDSENQPLRMGLEEEDFDERDYVYRPVEDVRIDFFTPQRGRSHVAGSSASRPRGTPWPTSMQGNPEKLWGEKGILARPEQASSKRGSLASEKKEKRTGSFKEMAGKLMQTSANFARKHSHDSRSTSPIKQGSVPRISDPHAPLPSAMRFPISLSRAEQMRLFGEVEYLLQTLANDFLLDQLSGHRLTIASLQATAKKWASRGRAQVLDMCWDLRTQLEVVQLNLNSVHFHGSAPATQHRRFCLAYAWKDVARELGVRSFCSADSAVKKMLSDCYIILDMLGAPGSWWLILQKLHVEALEKMKLVQSDKERERKERREREERLGKPMTVVLGSPVSADEDLQEKMTRRMAVEMGAL